MKTKKQVLGRSLFGALAFLVLLVFSFAGFAGADTAREIDVSADVALERFVEEVEGGEEFLEIAIGLLIFPEITKGGLIVGGEYGEGAMRIGGKTVEYYSTAGASFGLQIGIQQKALLIAFLTDDALEDFRHADGWEVGVDGSIAIIDVGKGGSIDSTTLDKPIYAFVFDQKGLMANITLEGSKFTKIER